MPDAMENSPSLADAAYRQLRDDIIACRLQPGQRITERELAKETGFGISPIRDALTRLDHDGLVRTIPRKGYQIAPLTLKVVDDLFAFWQIIGPECFKQGVMNASGAQLDRIVSDLNEIEDVTPIGHGQDELLRYVEIGNDLFSTLAEASGNSYLATTYSKLSGELFRVWTMISDSNLITATKFLNIADWSEVLHKRDGEALASNARTYIEACHQHIARTLARWPSVMNSEVVPLRAR